MSSPAVNDPNNARREAALEFLFGRIDYEKIPPGNYSDLHFKLGRMIQLLDRLAIDYQRLPVIHVAGTKGKGSTATMLGAVLTRAGLRTGVFSSPHLDRLEERIAMDGCPVDTGDFVGLVDRLKPAVRAMDQEAAAEGGPTYFELTTAMALDHFTRQEVDAAVLEVGLGGRLDSTNVCCPRVSVITSISLDHTQQLGNSLEAIAREKAGIIKPGVPVVSGVTQPGPRDEIRRVCRERGCRLIELGVDFDFDYVAPRGVESNAHNGKVVFRSLSAQTSSDNTPYSLGLLGRHQAANAAIALAVVAELRRQAWQIPESAVRAALAEATCRARVELIARRPAVVIDAAHNVASVEALIEVLAESFTAERRLLVFSTTQEKDIPGMLARLGEHFDEMIFTRYLSNPRAVPPEELRSLASELCAGRVRVCADPAEAWGAVLSRASPDDLVCVTGSFFLAAEMHRECRARPIAPHGES